MVVDEGANEEVEDKVVAHVEVRFEVAHVVAGLDEIELAYLNQL